LFFNHFLLFFLISLSLSGLPNPNPNPSREFAILALEAEPFLESSDQNTSLTVWSREDGDLERERERERESVKVGDREKSGEYPSDPWDPEDDRRFDRQWMELGGRRWRWGLDYGGHRNVRWGRENIGWFAVMILVVFGWFWLL
jgi:hypothetical protein